MAKIVDLSTAERPVPKVPGGPAPQAGPGVSDAGPRGLQEMARQIGLGAEELFRAERLVDEKLQHQKKVEEDRINTLRAEEAYTTALERKHELTFGEKGFTQMRGSDAISKPILTEYSKRLDDVESEISGTLTNDDQRLRFRQRMLVARAQYNDDILRHLAKERQTYGAQVYEGAIAMAQRDAVSRWDSPNDIASSLLRIHNAVAERADSEGWAPDFRKAKIVEEQSKVHSAVIHQAIDTGNYRYAEAWYKQNKANIDLPTARSLEKAVEDGTQKELAAGYNATYLANEDSPRALEQLRTKVMSDGTLNDDRKNMLVGRIQNRQYTLERRLEVAETRRLNTISRAVGELNGNTLAGFEPTPEQFAPVMAAAKGTELEGDVHQAIALAKQTRAFRNTPPLQQEQILAQAEAGVRTDPTKFDRRVVGAWRQIHDAQRRQVADNPIDFAVRQGIVPPPTPLDLSQPAKQADALAERFAVARGVASRYQAPFKPLTDGEVHLLTTTLGTASTEQKRNYFGALAQASAGDMQGYMGIMSQLAPDQPVTAIAGSHAARGNNTVADLMLRGQAILRPPAKADGKPDGGLLPMPEEKDMRSRFDSYVREAFTGKAEARSAHYQAAKSVYAALSVDAGDRDTKVLNQDRWEQAMTMAIGPVEKYQGRRIVMPQGYDYSRFRDGLRQRIDELVAGGRLDESWTASRVRDLPLENVGDGRYVFKVGDGVLTGLPNYGKPIIKNADGSISTERTVTVEADGKHLLVPTIVAGKQLPVAEAVQLWRDGKNQAVGTFPTAAAAEEGAKARSAALGRALAPQPVIINFNVDLPFRTSGHGLAPREDQTPAELTQAARPVTGRIQRPENAPK